MGADTSVDVDDVHWFHGWGPAEPDGPCPHSKCRHWGQSTIAHGPSLRHYELVRCDDDDGCNGECRAWQAATPTSNGGIPNSHPFLHVGRQEGERR